MIERNEYTPNYIKSIEHLGKTVNSFTKTYKKLVEISVYEEHNQQVSLDAIYRFESIANLLSEIASKTYINEFIEYDEKNQQEALLLNTWILLGSLTEVSLQMFQLVYVDDYYSAKWRIWDDWTEKKEEKVKNAINSTLQELKQSGYITKEQRKSIKKAVDKKISEHTKPRLIKKIMLDDLIDLYKKVNLINDKDKIELKKIQNNRNGIHSLEDRNIGQLDELEDSIRFLCDLLKWMMDRFPPVPDEDGCYIIEMF